MDSPLPPPPRDAWDRWCMAWALRDAVARGVVQPSIADLCRPLLLSGYQDDTGAHHPPSIVFGPQAPQPHPTTQGAMEGQLQGRHDPDLFAPPHGASAIVHEPVALADAYAWPLPPHAHARVALMAHTVDAPLGASALDAPTGTAPPPTSDTL